MVSLVTSGSFPVSVRPSGYQCRRGKRHCRRKCIKKNQYIPVSSPLLGVLAIFPVYRSGSNCRKYHYQLWRFSEYPHSHCKILLLLYNICHAGRICDRHNRHTKIYQQKDALVISAVMGMIFAGLALLTHGFTSVMFIACLGWPTP